MRLGLQPGHNFKEVSIPFWVDTLQFVPTKTSASNLYRADLPAGQSVNADQGTSKNFKQLAYHNVSNKVHERVLSWPLNQALLTPYLNIPRLNHRLGFLHCRRLGFLSCRRLGFLSCRRLGFLQHRQGPRMARGGQGRWVGVGGRELRPHTLADG